MHIYLENTFTDENGYEFIESLVLVPINTGKEIAKARKLIIQSKKCKKEYSVYVGDGPDEVKLNMKYFVE